MADMSFSGGKEGIMCKYENSDICKDGFYTSTGCIQNHRIYNLAYPPYEQTSTSVMQEAEKRKELDRFLSSTYDKKKTEEEDMSLIVTMINYNGIVMAADSKSSVKDGEGVLELDRCHPNRTKLFKTDSFLLGTVGTNSFVEDDKTVLMEDIINDIIKDGGNMEDVKNALSQKIHYCEGMSSEFLIGYKQGEIYHCDTFISNKKGFAPGPSFKRKDFIYTGYSNMVPRQITVRDEWSLEKMEDICRMVVEDAIRLGDLCRPYNPVGGKVHVVSLGGIQPGI